MPDVIIKGMEKMPPRCRECFAVHFWDDMDYCQIAEKWQPWDAVTRPDWCPLRPAPEWISVEDDLPKYRKRVIIRAGVFVGDGYLASKDRWHRSFGVPVRKLTDQPVTHWMPLPEPPEEETT